MTKYKEDEQFTEYFINNLTYFTGDLDSDCFIMHDILSQLTYKSGTDRYKLCKTTGGNGSILYGNTWRGFLKYDKEGNQVLRKPDPDHKGRYYSKAQSDYPDLMDIAKEFRDLHFPDFHFTHLMLNKNYPVDWHFDKANVGDSYIVAFGDFQGGETEIEVGGVVYKIDTHNKPYCFNGSIIKHRCAPFTGERYAIVFFNN